MLPAMRITRQDGHTMVNTQLYSAEPNDCMACLQDVVRTPTRSCLETNKMKLSVGTLETRTQDPSLVDTYCPGADNAAWRINTSL